ncbi:hypothetical protein C9374_013990 [Naegleria lovaniensis]|uniref:Uncharacterized protein n=1 Tax=Naegleria lovaniensis TaxID=51637 RepID=A0AA88GYL0_NAELO|nr:uncharacterized protein C9374_013990 [Naegleria lovaniensis]KAG2389430.1 hypothetical protein C9374_013990 [Naegleria lovaniensis]
MKRSYENYAASSNSYPSNNAPTSTSTNNTTTTVEHETMTSLNSNNNKLENDSFLNSPTTKLLHDFQVNPSLFQQQYQAVLRQIIKSTSLPTTTLFDSSNGCSNHPKCSSPTTVLPSALIRNPFQLTISVTVPSTTALSLLQTSSNTFLSSISNCTSNASAISPKTIPSLSPNNHNLTCNTSCSLTQPGSLYGSCSNVSSSSQPSSSQPTNNNNFSSSSSRSNCDSPSSMERVHKKLKLTTLGHLAQSLPYCIKLLILHFVELPILQYVEFKELPQPFDMSKLEHSCKLGAHLMRILFGYFTHDSTRTIHLLFPCLDFTTYCHDPAHHHFEEQSESDSNGNMMAHPHHRTGTSTSFRSLSTSPIHRLNTSSSTHCPLESIRFTDNLERLMFRCRKFISLKFSDCNLSGEEMKCFGVAKQGIETLKHNSLKTLDFSKNHNFSAAGFKQYLPTIEQMHGAYPYPNLTYLNLLETATDAVSLLYACTSFPKLQILKHSFSQEHVVEYNVCVKGLAAHKHLQQLHLECTSGYYELNMKDLLQSKSLKKIALFGFQFSDDNVSCEAFRNNTSLKKLSLTNCFIAPNRETVAESVSSSRSIRELIFSDINLENKDIQLISERMDLLQNLIIGGCDSFHMNSTGFTNFSMLKSLQKFVIDGFSDYCSLNFETCRAFCLSSLTFLELDGFQEANDSYLALMLKQGVNLKALKVKQTRIACKHNHTELATALRNHKCLRHLKLDENEAIGDSGVMFLLRNLPPSLVKLGLTMCNISDIGAKALFSNKQIRKLKVKMNNITDESLKLLRYNTTLIYISIDALRGEEVVRVIGEENKTLRQLSVISIPLTYATIDSLTKNTTLHYLKIKNCDQLNKELKQKLTDRASFGVIFRGIFSENAFL